jgi:hypothetical protein
MVMSPLDRRRLALSLTLALCLALLGCWWMFRGERAIEPAPVQNVAPSVVVTPEEPQELTTGTAAAQKPGITADAAPSLGTLRGKVIDAVTHQPVREFELKVRPMSGGELDAKKRSFRSVDGRFEWPNILPRAWHLFVTARAYQPFQLRGSLRTPGEITPEVVFPLRSGSRLRGRVYDLATGDGISAANISFREAHLGRFEGEWRSRPSATSGKNGSFLLEGVPYGAITLQIDAQQYAGREVNVVIEKKTTPVEIGLAAGGTIAGRFTAADGYTPAAGSVGLEHLDQHFGGSQPTAEGSGFSYEHLPAGRYRLRGQSGGASISKDIVLAENERLEGIVLALGAGHSVRGTITGLGPEELPRVSVFMQREDDDAPGSFQEGVDERGAYVLQGVQPGRATIFADHSMRRQLSKTIEIPADADLTVNFDFPSGARLSGRVTRGGKPWSGVHVGPAAVVKQGMDLYGTNTTAKGEYVIEDLAAGEYVVWVGAYRSRVVQVSSDTVFDIDVPLASLSGRVVEAGGTLPVVDAEVVLWSLPSDSEPQRNVVYSDHFGQFVFAGLEAGDLMLSAYKPGYEMGRQRVTYNPPAADITFSLRQSGGVEITVREAVTGNALRVVEVTEIVGNGTGSFVRLRLDEKGVGYLPEALAGSTLSFASSGHAPSVVRAWSGQSLDVRLSPRSQQRR